MSELTYYSNRYKELLIAKGDVENAIMVANTLRRPVTHLFIKLAEIQSELVDVDDRRTSLITGVVTEPNKYDSIASLYVKGLNAIDNMDKANHAIKELTQENDSLRAEIRRIQTRYYKLYERKTTSATLVEHFKHL